MTTTMFSVRQYTEHDEWRIVTKEIPMVDDTMPIIVGTIFPVHTVEEPYHYEGELFGWFVQDDKAFFTLVEHSEPVEPIFSVQAWFEPMGWVDIHNPKSTYDTWMEANDAICGIVNSYYAAVEAGHQYPMPRLLPMRVVVRSEANGNYTVVP